jgi:hypothetical protein
MHARSFDRGPASGRGNYAIATHASGARTGTAAKTKTRRKFAKNATASESHRSEVPMARAGFWCATRILPSADQKR